ncbi:alpha/beta hydrolase [Rhodococcus sp. NPDC058521]|uniref:alpha/beta hydrolase n=1 Tax=Rhodococcus sp. NPDC058521 TaxID=3346536 RepID=UPI003667075D
MLEVIDKGQVSALHDTPLLFIHGGYHGAWCWDEHFLDWFADKGYRALAVSLRGHGNSPTSTPIRNVTIADYVDDVVSIADMLSTKPVVIGHSIGGFIVQKYLESHDAPAAVLISPTSPRSARGSVRRAARRHPRLTLEAMLTRNPLHLVETPALARELFFSAQMPAAQVEHYAAQLVNESDHALRDLMLSNGTRPRLGSTPVLVLGAEGDTANTPEEVRATARADGLEAELFPGMAHDMMLEPGWQNVAERILEWLGTHDL